MSKRGASMTTDMVHSLPDLNALQTQHLRHGQDEWRPVSIDAPQLHDTTDFRYWPGSSISSSVDTSSSEIHSRTHSGFLSLDHGQGSGSSGHHYATANNTDNGSSAAVNAPGANALMAAPEPQNLTLSALPMRPSRSPEPSFVSSSESENLADLDYSPSADRSDRRRRVSGPEHRSQSVRRQLSSQDFASTVDSMRPRHKCSPEQLEQLQAFFDSNRNPKGKVREELAARLGMPERSVQIWFQNK